MIGLVDYGSGSESDSDGETVQQQAVIRTQNGPEKTRGVFDEEKSFSANTGSSLNLPSATNGAITNHQTEENELEGVVKPRDWEQELAEKNKKKLEKRAKKKEKKEKKHKKNKGDKAEKKEKKPVNKTKISAFGALGTLGAESDSDEEEHEAKPEATRSTTSSSKSALLNLLPAPKAKTKSSSVFGKGTGGSSMLLPSTLRKTPAAAAPKVQPATSSLVSKRKKESDESDDDDVTDFFGLTVAPEVKRTRVDEEREIPLMATGTGFESFGPSKPSEEEEMHPSQMYNYADVDIDELPQRRAGFISDEQAFNLISRDETVQVGDRRTLNEITAGIIDVSVDQALGPSVQSSLLKQVTKQAYIRDVNALPAKTGTVDKVARQKHQITYLAKLAVAREAALEEQWASSKNQKRMARQKYGF